MNRQKPLRLLFTFLPDYLFLMEEHYQLQHSLCLKTEKMFIKLTAAFRAEGQPDFEELGIKPATDDFDDSDWEPLFIHHDYIATMNVNDMGNTNVSLITGVIWSVKESPEEIAILCMDAQKSIS